MRSFGPSLQFVRHSLLACFCLWTAVTNAALALADEDSSNDPDDEFERKKPKTLSELRAKLSESKLWFLRDIDAFGVRIPISPVTLLAILLVLLHVISTYGTYAWCEASHILLKDHSDETKKLLKQWKKEIGDDYTKFSEYAKKHSECPSGRKSSIGWFQESLSLFEVLTMFFSSILSPVLA